MLIHAITQLHLEYKTRTRMGMNHKFKSMSNTFVGKSRYLAAVTDVILGFSKTPGSARHSRPVFLFSTATEFDQYIKFLDTMKTFSNLKPEALAQLGFEEHFKNPQNLFGQSALLTDPKEVPEAIAYVQYGPLILAFANKDLADKTIGKDKIDKALKAEEGLYRGNVADEDLEWLRENEAAMEGDKKVPARKVEKISVSNTLVTPLYDDVATLMTEQSPEAQIEQEVELGRMFLKQWKIGQPS